MKLLLTADYRSRAAEVEVRATCFYLHLYHSPPLSLLLCQLLWGGPEGMLMACHPHTPWPHIPLAGMWLCKTKACWNFTPPVLCFSCDYNWTMSFSSVFYFHSFILAPRCILHRSCVFLSCLFGFSFVLLFESLTWHMAMTLLGLLEVWMGLCEHIAPLLHPVLASPSPPDHTHRGADPYSLHTFVHHKTKMHINTVTHTAKDNLY